jgi:hypothetical protein
MMPPPERFTAVFDRSVIWRLLKLRTGGTSLPAEGDARIREILGRHPDWPDSTTERDEFLVLIPVARHGEAQHGVELDYQADCDGPRDAYFPSRPLVDLVLKALLAKFGIIRLIGSYDIRMTSPIRAAGIVHDNLRATGTRCAAR